MISVGHMLRERQRGDAPEPLRAQDASHGYVVSRRRGPLDVRGSQRERTYVMG